MSSHYRSLVIRLGFPFGLWITGASFLGGFLSGCGSTPVTERRQFVLVPEAVLESQSVEAFAEMRRTVPLVQDPLLRQKVLEIGQKLTRASNGKLDWDFELFDSPDVNAFCMPGGKIGVFSGILPIAKTNAGLAAILGHEIAHALARHSAERATQAILIGGVVSVVNKELEGNRNRGAATKALEIGAQLGLLLPFGRGQESEADEIGLEYMARAGYDPTEAVRFWERMNQNKVGESFEWLSTHPSPTTRVTQLEKLIPKAQDTYLNSGNNKIPTEDL